MRLKEDGELLGGTSVGQWFGGRIKSQNVKFTILDGKSCEATRALRQGPCPTVSPTTVYWRALAAANGRLQRGCNFVGSNFVAGSNYASVVGGSGQQAGSLCDRAWAGGRDKQGGT